MLESPQHPFRKRITANASASAISLLQLSMVETCFTQDDASILAREEVGAGQGPQGFHHGHQGDQTSQEQQQRNGEHGFLPFIAW